LLDGGRLILDATHVEANAALKGLRAEPMLLERGGEAAPEPEPTRPALTLVKPRSGPTPRRSASNWTALSLSDPDSSGGADSFTLRLVLVIALSKLGLDPLEPLGGEARE